MMAASGIRGEVRDFIGGEWRKPSSDPALDVLNPATGEVIAKAPSGSATDVAAAVDAAAAAFPEWRATPPARSPRSP